MIDEELVRCRPCGYVMKKSELNGVCPACGLPENVFEPYRERVSADRLFLLSLDIHPIAIHLSQTFVVLAPLLAIFHLVFPGFLEDILHPVIAFSVYVLPFTLVLSFVSGIFDGILRFKTLRTPLLKKKIVYSILILTFSITEAFVFKAKDYGIGFILLSVASTACAVKLGLLGKHLIDVILPGALVLRKSKKKNTTASKPAAKHKPVTTIEEPQDESIHEE